MKRTLVVLFALAGVILTGCSRPSPTFTGDMRRQAPWNPELVAEMVETDLKEIEREAWRNDRTAR